jgi:hypothetical protein
MVEANYLTCCYFYFIESENRKPKTASYITFFFAVSL